MQFWLSIPATEACSTRRCGSGTLCAHFEICPREHTQRILPLVQDVLNESHVSLTGSSDATAFGRQAKERYRRTYYRHCSGAGAGAELPMIGVSTGYHGAGRMA